MDAPAAGQLRVPLARGHTRRLGEPIGHGARDKRVHGLTRNVDEELVPRPEKSARSAREETAAIRQWAREHGHQVSERGRISKSILEAYRAAS
jgi:hypothetical protein